MEQSRFLTPPEVAKILGVSADHVVEYINRRELKAVNTSLRDRPRWKVSEANLEEFIQKRSNIELSKEVQGDN
jgi:excisionase family DNA binding protein